VFAHRLKHAIVRHGVDAEAIRAGRRHVVLMAAGVTSGRFVEAKLENPAVGIGQLWRSLAGCNGSKRRIGEGRLTGIEPSTPAFRR